MGNRRGQRISRIRKDSQVGEKEIKGIDYVYF